MMNKLPSMIMTVAMMLGFCAGDVWAQHQLDNNLEQSSGQVNPQATNVDYGSRNDIIYGNINGGKGFRGNIKYGAPGDFRGNTGSDELYRYRANATPSSTGQQFIQPQSVQRASHSAILGNIQSNNQYKPGTINSSGIPIDAYRTGQATSTGQMIQTPEFGASRAGTVGIQGDLSGQSLGVGATSSQYLGVPNDTPVGAVNLRPMAVGGNRSTSLGTQTDANLIGALSSQQGATATVGHGISSTSDSLWKVDPDKNLAYPNSTAPTPQEVILPNQNAPSNLLSPQPANEQGMTMEEKAVRLQAQQMKLEASLMTNVGEDAYMKVQQNQANRQRVAQGLKPIQHGVDPDNQLVADPSQVKQLPSHQTLFNSMTGLQSDGSPSPQADGSSIQPMPGYGASVAGGSHVQPTSLLNPNITAPNTLKATAAQEAQARQQLQDAMLQSRGVTNTNSVLDQVLGIPTPSTEPQPMSPAKPTGGLFGSDATLGGSSNADVHTGQTHVDQMLLGGMSSTQTGITVPGTTLPPTTESMQREWQSSRALTQPTLALKAGRYFDAERLYKSVLLGDTQSYEASAGLICAQLGAGLVRATGLNLRQHMSKFPQHVSSKLDKDLLPSGKRLAWVRQQAQTLMEQYGNYDAALLIAFMGYQTSDAQMLQYGLGLAQKHLPGDPLVAELSRAWLGQ